MALRAAVALIFILIGFAAAAQNCATATRLISTKASVPNLLAGPSAWTGNALGVVHSDEANDAAIWFGLYSENLDTLIAPRLVANDAADDEAITALLFNGTDFALFYRTDDVIRLQRLTVTGDPIGAPIAITADRRPRLADEIEVIWSDRIAAYVMARHISQGRDRGIWVTVLEKDGSVRSDGEIPASPPSNPDLAVAVASDGVIGLFHLSEDDGMVQYTRLVSGRFPETRSIASAATNIQAVAYDDLFVVTRLVGEGTTAEIRWFVVSSDDEIVRPDGVLVASNGNIVLQPLGLIALDDELALTYAIPVTTATVIPDMHLRRFTIAGSTISDTPFAAGDFTASRALSAYAPVWTGTSFLTAAIRETSARLDSYLLRYCPLRAQVQAPQLVLVDTPVTISSSVSGGLPGYSYAWTIARDPGGPRTGASIQRTFSALGSRPITLVVTDSNGATTTATFTIEVVDKIEEPEPPKQKRRAVRK
jgi:hypothetical protein